MEEALKELLTVLISDQTPFSIVVPTADDWEFPLDTEIASQKMMMLALNGWSLEQASMSGAYGIYIKIAFGDNENSKVFNLGDIHGVIDKDGKPLFQRVFSGIHQEQGYTLKGLIDSEGAKNSMDAMKRNNPGKFKDKK